MRPTPVLSRFRLVSRSRVLLERPIHIAEVLNVLENVASVDFLVDFDSLIHENEGGLTASADSAPDNGRRVGSLSGPAPVVLGVVRLLDGEQLLVREQDALPSLSSGPTLELATSLEPHTFVFIGEQLNFLELVRHQVKLPFCRLSHRFTFHSSFTGDFSHGDPRISLDSLPDNLAVNGRVDGASSTTSWTTTIVAELLETIDGLGHSLLRHIKQANNITFTHSFTKQLQNCTTFI